MGNYFGPCIEFSSLLNNTSHETVHAKPKTERTQNEVRKPEYGIVLGCLAATTYNGTILTALASGSAFSYSKHQVCMNACMHAHVYVCIYIYTHIHTNTDKPVFICIYVYTYMHLYRERERGHLLKLCSQQLCHLALVGVLVADFICTGISA